MKDVTRFNISIVVSQAQNTSNISLNNTIGAGIACYGFILELGEL
jgi:hypothetical protein